MFCSVISNDRKFNPKAAQLWAYKIVLEIMCLNWMLSIEITSKNRFAGELLAVKCQKVEKSREDLPPMQVSGLENF